MSERRCKEIKRNCCAEASRAWQCKWGVDEYMNFEVEAGADATVSQPGLGLCSALVMRGQLRVTFVREHGGL